MPRNEPITERLGRSPRLSLPVEPVCDRNKETPVAMNNGGRNFEPRTSQLMNNDSISTEYLNGDLPNVPNGLASVPSELFGRFFPIDADPANAAAAFVACHLEGFAVDQGPGPGQANIDERTLAVNNKASFAALRLVSRAADPQDAANLLNEAVSPNARDKASMGFRRAVTGYRAVIKSYRQAISTDKAICDLPASFSNTHEIITTRIVPHLNAAGCYVREGGLCRVIPGAGSSDSEITFNALVISQHKLPSLSADVTKSIAFRRERETKAGMVFKECSAPRDLMEMVLHLGDWRGVPYLKGVTTGPFMRSDGSVCVTSGYDALTGWYLDYRGEPIEVPDNPTKADAELAANILLDLVAQFEWASESQKVGWLAYVLTLVARPGIKGNVPAFVFTSSNKRSGKTLLTEVANIIPYGETPGGYQAPSGEQASTEWKKALFSFALSGSPSLVISNVPSGSSVGNSMIDGVLTDGRIMDRQMGTHDSKTAPWVAVLSMNGNNLGTSADFAPRSIWACLEPQSENPGERDGFQIPDLKSHVMDMRSELLGACLTILRWGYRHGRIKPNPDTPNSGGFEQWAATVRYPLAHLTGFDVARNGADATVTDTAGSELETLITGLREYTQWRKESGRKAEFALSELHIDLNDRNNGDAWGELRELLEFDCSLRSFNTSAGKVLNTYRGRVCEGSKLTMKLRAKKPFWNITQR